MFAIEGFFRGSSGGKEKKFTEGGRLIKKWKLDPHDAVFSEMIPSMAGKDKINMTKGDVKDVISKLKDKGFISIGLPDTWYDSVISDWNGLPMPHDVKVMFNPKDIRSKFAKFDPKNKGSASLLGGLGALGLGATLSGDKKEDSF